MPAQTCVIFLNLAYNSLFLSRPASAVMAASPEAGALAPRGLINETGVWCFGIAPTQVILAAPGVPDFLLKGQCWGLHEAFVVVFAPLEHVHTSLSLPLRRPNSTTLGSRGLGFAKDSASPVRVHPP